MPVDIAEPVGHYWRSSGLFVVVVISVALFSDSFLFSFIVPILRDVLEDRLQLPPSQTQRITSILLSMNALISILIAPIVGHLADNVSSKNRLMILAWVINIVGTVVTAWSMTLIHLFLGRLIQTIAGSLLWIIGMAILGDATGPAHLGKTLGFACMFVSAGFLSGPAVSGTLYEVSGYWVTWAAAFAILVCGTVMQLAMIEPSGNGYISCQLADDSRRVNSNNEASFPFMVDIPSNSRDARMSMSEDEEETTALLRPASNPSTEIRPCQSILKYDHHPTHPEDKTLAGQNVYSIMLREGRVVTALASDIIFAMVTASFEATIPLHVKSIFGWNSLETGLLFLLIQVPSLLLLTPFGWLKDRIGMRYPVTVGFLLFAPSLWLLGIPGKGSFGWINCKQAGQAIYIVALIGIGIWRTLILGFGAFEVMNAAAELDKKSPGIFGPNGGYSRAYSMSSICWKFGMLLGPLISGALVETIGYYYMNLFFAILCLLMGASTYSFLG